MQVRRLLARRGVGRRAHAVEELRDLDRRVALGALEQQVLEEVRDARLLRALVAGAGAHPHAERHRAHRGHRLGDRPGCRPRARSAERPREARPAAPALRDAWLNCAGVRCRRDRGRGRRPAARARRPPPSRPPPRGPRSPEPTSTSSSADLPSTAGSSESRRPIRPRSRSTSTTVTSSSSPCYSTSSTALDPLAGLDVRDVQQPVGALRQLDERAEGSRLHDLALELVADLGLLGHRLDAGDAASTRAPLGA